MVECPKVGQAVVYRADTYLEVEGSVLIEATTALLLNAVLDLEREVTS